jgi:hypothetical protein
MELIQEHSICELLIKNISDYHTFYSQATKIFAAQVCACLVPLKWNAAVPRTHLQKGRCL